MPENGGNYDRIERLRRDLCELRLPEDAQEYDLRPTGEVRGVVEGFAYLLPPFDAPVLKIGDGWLKVTHKALREAMRVLRPELGEQIAVECLGKNGGEYGYAVSVGNGERTWPV